MNGEKFTVLADLGFITVPHDYVHATWLDSFRTENRGKFHHYNDAIADANFPNPSRILQPGDKLRVSAITQAMSGTTTSEERMALLAARKAIHTGAQGASLVWKQKRDQLPKGICYCSFDEEGRLWRDAAHHRRVPRIDASSDGTFRFSLSVFECPWFPDFAFFLFTP